MIILRPKMSYPTWHHPLFYLAGPILGGDEWQARACTVLEKICKNPLIAVPNRWESDHPLSPFFVNMRESFSRQVDWERKYMMKAAAGSTPGCLIFWLPAESIANPRNDGSPYARDTYGELGEWRAHLIYRPKLRTVIGAEAEFPGLSVIQRNFEKAIDSTHEGKFKLLSSLEETLQAAVTRAAYF